jgi:hypothetical protein
VTVRGFLVSDEYEDALYTDEVLANLERGFKRVARHTDCAVCHGDAFAHLAFVWPRNGFSEFPLNWKPPLAPVVQSV